MNARSDRRRSENIIIVPRRSFRRGANGRFYDSDVFLLTVTRLRTRAEMISITGEHFKVELDRLAVVY